MKTFTVTLTEDLVDTILGAMPDYMLHHDPAADPEDLIGGIPVPDRVQAIEDILLADGPTYTLTEDLVDTILSALDDYIMYDDEDTDPEDLFGGTPVAERVHAIEKILLNCASN